MRQANWLIGVLLVALGFNIAMGLVSYAKAQTTTAPKYIPVIATAPDTSPARLVTLVDHDTTFVNAANVPGTCRVIVTYIDRANGNRLHVTEHITDTLRELPLPPLAALLTAPSTDTAPQPQFEYPGPKHASGYPLFVCSRLRVYANARDTLTGPFKLMVLDMPTPPQPAP